MIVADQRADGLGHLVADDDEKRGAHAEALDGHGQIDEKGCLGDS